MSGIVRYFLIFVAVIVVLIAALAVLIQTQLTPERVRTTFLPLVEQQLGRSVEIGDIDIGILSGVTLNDLIIREAQSSDVFVAVATAGLSYRLWPLLKGQLDIREISLDQPSITLIRLPDGHFNISDLINIDDHDEPRSDSDTDIGATITSVFDLLIQRIKISNGRILFIDRHINPAAPFRYNFSNLNLTVKEMSLHKSFPVDISVVLNQAQLSFSAQVDPARRSGNALVRISSLDLIPFVPYYRDQLPGPIGSALLDVNLDLEWNSQELVSRGRIGLNQLDLVLRDLPDMPLRGVRLTADYAVRYDLVRELLEISTALLNYNDIRMTLQGGVNLSTSDPKLNLDFILDRGDLRHSLQSLPQSLTRQLQPYSPAGVLTARLRLSGPVSSGFELIHSAHLRLADVQATFDTVRTGVNGDIHYSSNGLESNNLIMKAGDQQARLVFHFEDLRSEMVRGSFTLSAREVDLNQFLPEADSSTPATATDVPSVNHEPGPYDLPVHLVGSINIDRLGYRNLAMQQVNARLELKDNRLTIAPFGGRIGDGQFSIESVIDLGVEGLSYQGQVGLSQPDLSTLISGLFPAAQQKVTGQLMWINNFSGRGTVAENLLQALQLEGEFRLSQGGFSDVELLNQVSWFLDSPDLKQISFREFAGSYRLKDGKALIDSHMDGSRVKLTPKGSIGVDGSINLSLATRLAPEVLSRMGASDRLKQAFVDDSGWGVLPLEIGGSFADPRVGFDTRALERQVVEQATQEASDRLLEKLLPEVQEESRESLRQLLDNTLRRLRTP